MYETTRRYHRYPVFARAVVTIKTDSEEQELTAQVKTISQGGMGVYTDVPLKKHTPISAQFSYLIDDETGNREVLDGSVASQTKQYNQYFVGICFDEPLTHDHLMKILKWD